MRPERLKKQFGRVIKRRRNEAGLSQNRLAVLAGIDRRYVALLERGGRNPSLVVMAKLAEALKIGLDELVAELLRDRR